MEDHETRRKIIRESMALSADIAVEPNVGFRETADIARSGHQTNR
jgi:hypothetical protein